MTLGCQEGKNISREYKTNLDTVPLTSNQYMLEFSFIHDFGAQIHFHKDIKYIGANMWEEKVL